MIKGFRSTNLLVLLLFVSTSLFANPCPSPYGLLSFDCDFCGCATTGGNFGYGTLGDVNFFGLRYSYQQFESKDGIFADSPISKEYFNTYQLWSKIPITQRIHLSATLPYQDLNREYEDRSESLNGIGDASVIGWYTFPFVKKGKKGADNDSSSKMVGMPKYSGHTIKFGLGIKLPTGEFEEVLTDRVNPGFQLGTGSTDAIFSAGYSYSKNMFGVNVTGSYFLKGENKNEYRFGDQVSYNAKFFKGFLVNTHVLTPFVGVSGDFFQKIVQFGDALPDTDGYMHLGTFGAEFNYKRLVMGADIGIPINQDLFAGDVQIKKRLMFYLNFTL